MAGRFDWSKANIEEKVRKQNLELYQESVKTPPAKSAKPDHKTNSKGKKTTSGGKQSAAARRASSRLHYIKAVRFHVETGAELPPLFKKIAPKVKREIQKAPSIVAWAKAQPEYDTFGKEAAASQSAENSSSIKKWRSDLSTEITNLEVELRAVETRRKTLLADLRRKRKALTALG